MRILGIFLAACIAGCGSKGPAGPAGPAGPVGPQGATGPQGPAGVSSLDAPINGSRVVVHVTRMVGADGAQSPGYVGYQFYDTLLAVECDLRPATDGTTRCFPLHAGWGGEFLDSACTTPMASLPTACAPAYVVDYPGPTNSGVCSNGAGSAYRVFQVGAAVVPAKDPATGYDKFAHLPAGCSAPSASCPCLYDGTFAGDPSLSWYAITELPPTDFVQFSPQ